MSNEEFSKLFLIDNERPIEYKDINLNRINMLDIAEVGLLEKALSKAVYTRNYDTFSQLDPLLLLLEQGSTENSSDAVINCLILIHIL